MKTLGNRVRVIDNSNKIKVKFWEKTHHQFCCLPITPCSLNFPSPGKLAGKIPIERKTKKLEKKKGKGEKEIEKEKSK